MPEQLSRQACIVIFTIGTHGDIRPCVALGLGLQQLGYHVRIATSSNFAEWIQQQGLAFAELSADFQALLNHERELAEQGLNIGKMATVFRQQFAHWANDWAVQGVQAAQNAQLILGVGNATLLAQAVAELQQVAFVRVQLQPLTPSRRLPPMLVAGHYPGWVNWSAYQVMRLLVWYVMQPAINRQLRPRLGLKPYPWYGPYFNEHGLRSRVLYGFSPYILPAPSDWPDSAKVCGYWSLAAPAWQPEPALAAFLQQGPAPVYVGFGSMLSRDAEGFTRQILDGLQQRGQRAVLALGWGGLQAPLGQLNQQVFVIRDAPHAGLLPHMSMAIHHGGAGTAAAVATAGIPSIVMPFYGDQPFWARRLQAVGVAAPALSRRTLSAERLAQALDIAGQPEIRQRAARLGQRLRAEDGVTVAISHLQHWGLLPAIQQGTH